MAVCTALCAAASLAAVLLTPVTAAGARRGWNSYDGYGGAVNESTLLAAAAYMQTHLLPYGYDTLVLDEGWSEQSGAMTLDTYGRPIPNAALYPSSAGGAGFTPLVTQLAGMGLKLGVWVMRGIPRDAVAARMPIAGSTYSADQAARYDKNCTWSSKCFGTNAPSAPASAYYQSVAALFTSWGLHFVKYDCMFPNRTWPQPEPYGYYDEDLVAMSSAFTAAGFTISLSPGISVTPGNGSFIAANHIAQSYRVAEDMWDVYYSRPDGSFPTGIKQKLDLARNNYSSLIGVNGTFPDWDMLPLGVMLHADEARGGPYGPPSATHLTNDEQVTTMTLWCMTRASLMFGGRLPLDANDTWTLSLITNADVLAVHNSSSNNRPIPYTANVSDSNVPDNTYAWAADMAGVGVCVDAPSCVPVALFSALNETVALTVTLEDAGFPAGATVRARDLWSGQLQPGTFANSFTMAVQPHGAVMLRLWQV